MVLLVYIILVLALILNDEQILATQPVPDQVLPRNSSSIFTIEDPVTNCPERQESYPGADFNNDKVKLREVTKRRQVLKNISVVHVCTYSRKFTRMLKIFTTFLTGLEESRSEEGSCIFR